jgi:hypothetical protein
MSRYNISALKHSENMTKFEAKFIAIFDQLSAISASTEISTERTNTNIL